MGRAGRHRSAVALGVGLALLLMGATSVHAQNSAPSPSFDDYTATQGQTLSVSAANGVLANDTDPDGDSLTVTSVASAPSNGDLTLDPDGSFEYTSDSSFASVESFSYEVSDGSATAEGVVEITVQEDTSSGGTNSAPVTETDSYTATQGQALSVSAANGVLANDTDPDGDSLSASVVSDVTNGTLVLDGDGSFDYTPDSTFTGVDDFTYEAADGNGGTDQNVVEIFVEEDTSGSGGTNSAPVAETDSYTATQGQALSVSAANGVLANDTDPDGDSLSASVVSGPASGSLTLDPDGSFDYVSDSTFTGVDDFTYEAADGNGGTDQNIVEIFVEEDTTEGDTGVIPPQPAQLAASDTTNGVSLSWTAPDSASIGAYNVYRDTAPIDSSAGPSGLSVRASVTAPTTSYTDSMVTSGATYYYRVTAQDSAGTESGFSNEGQVTVDGDTTGGTTLAVSALQPESAAPGATVRIYGAGFDPAPENNTVIFGAREEAVIDSARTNVLYVQVPSGVSGPVELTVSSGGPTAVSPQPFTVLTGGSEAFDSLGTLTNVQRGDLDWGDYNGDGRLDVVIAGSNQTVIHRNDGGTFTAIDAGLMGVREDVSVEWGDYNNDGNLDLVVMGKHDGAATTAIYRNDGNGSFTKIGAGLQGLFRGGVDWGDYNKDGKLDLVVTGYDGSSSYTQVYRNDGNGTFTAIEAGLSGVFNSAAKWGDYNGDGLLDLVVSGSGTATIYRNDGGGTFTDISAGLTGVNFGTAVDWGDYDGDADLDVVITGSGQSGGTTTIYRNDGNDTFSSISAGVMDVEQGAASWGDYDGDGQVDLVVTGRNASGDQKAALYRNEGGGTFTEVNASLTGVAFSAQEWGDFDGDGALDLVVAGQDTSTASNKTILYRNGSERTTNEPPVASADSFGTQQGQTLTVSAPGVLGNDSDPDGDSLTASVAVRPDSGSLSLDATGAFEYTPDSGFAGIDAFTYAAADSNGAADTARVEIGVEPRRGLAVSVPLTVRTGAGNAQALTLGLDPEATGGLDSALGEVEQPPPPPAGVFDARLVNTDGGDTSLGEGVLTDVRSGAAEFEGTVIHALRVQSETDSSTIEWSLPADVTGVLEDASTGGGEVRVNMSGTGAATLATPEARRFTVTLQYGQTVRTPAVSVPVSVRTDAGNAQFLAAGLDPAATTGIDSSFGEEEQPPLPPSDVFDARWIDDDIAASGLGEGLLVDVRPGSTDVEATRVHELQVQPGSEADSSTVSWALPPDVTGTLEDVGSGGTEVSAAMADSGAVVLTDTSQTRLRITLEYGRTDNAPPTAEPDSFAVQGGETLSVPAPGVLENDSDPDGDSLRVSLVSDVTDGTLALEGDGAFTYTPDPTFGGTDAFTYAVADGNGGSAEARVEIQVEAGTAVPTRVRATPGEKQVQLRWTAPTLGDVDGYHIYRDTSTFDSTAVPSDLMPYDSTESGTTTVTDTSVTPGTTYYYRVTVVGPDGAETAFSRTARGVPEGLVASVSRSVSSDSSEQDFEETGTGLKFSGVSGSGNVTVNRYAGTPDDTSGIDTENVSSERVVIEADETLSFDGAEVRLAVSRFSGITNPKNVSVYKRDTPGEGTFQRLDTRVGDNNTPDNPSDDTLYATTDSFSEFTLGSDTEPLPVEMASIDAQLDDEAVHLSWTTASEKDNAGFRIQRKVGTKGGEADPDVQASRRDASTWTTVDFVDGAGTTSQAQRYRFTDGDLPYEADRLTYRLKQVDTDGSVNYTDPVTVRRTPKRVRLLGTYPNPARHQVTVRYALPEKRNATLRLYDVLGRQVKTLVQGTQQGRKKRRLDVSALPSGVYFLRLRSDGETRTQKLTIVQ